MSALARQRRTSEYSVFLAIAAQELSIAFLQSARATYRAQRKTVPVIVPRQAMQRLEQYVHSMYTVE